MAGEQFRQGDVMLIRVAGLPDYAIPRPPAGDRWVLAEGEATGHTHSVAADAAQLLDQGGVTYLRVHQTCRLEHQEHEPIPLSPGLYRVVRQREYDPLRPRPISD
jgi:hypothetical protein